MEYMDDYIFFISLGIIFCSLIAVLFIYKYCLQIKRRYNYSIVKSIREQERVTKELERMRIEKKAFEKVLKTKLTEVVEISDEVVEIDKQTGHERHILHIDITYFL